MRRLPLLVPFVLAVACDKVEQDKDFLADSETVDQDGLDTDESDVIRDTFDSGSPKDSDSDVVDTVVADTDTGDTGSTGVWTGGTGWGGGTGGWWGGSGWGGWDTFDTATTPACSVTDPNEPNNRPYSATPTSIVGAGGTFSLTQVPLSGMRDQDWFELLVPAGCVVDASITFDHTVGDGALTAVSWSAVLDASDDPVADHEAIAWGNTGGADQTVFVVVTQSDQACLLYDLEVAVSCPTPCVPTDTSEPNGDTGNAEATLDSADTDPAGVFEAAYQPMAGALYDHDFYRVPLEPGCSVVADVLYDPADGDVQAELQTPRGYTLDLSEDTDGDEVVTGFNRHDWPTYLYLDVYSDDRTCTVYDVDVVVECTGLPPGLTEEQCAYDPYESNDDLVSATDAVAMGTVGTFAADDLGIDGRVTPSDDWYHTVVPAHCAYYAQIAFQDQWADLDLYVHGAFGPFGGSTTLYDQEAVRAFSRSPVPTDLWLQVVNTSNTCNVYDLLVDVYCPDPATFRVCGADAYEPNEDAATATATGLADGGDEFVVTDVEADVASSDLDHYAVSVPDGCSVEADLTFARAISEIAVGVVDAGANYLAIEYGSGGPGEHVSWPNTTGSAQDVYVQVLPYGYTCNLYDLDVEIVCP